MTDGPSPKLCFVASPIGDPGTPERDHADWLLQTIITPIFNQYYPAFRVERADKITTPGMIDSQVINRLHDAPLVIVDMSFQNANVFYEMGIRHMKRLPTIHMYREDQQIPFDVKPYRAIPFNYRHPDDMEKAKRELRTVVDEVLAPEFTVENPVTRARGFEKLQEGASSAERLLMGELADLKERQGTFEIILKRMMKVGVTNSAPERTALDRLVLSHAAGADLGQGFLRPAPGAKTTTIFTSGNHDYHTGGGILGQHYDELAKKKHDDSNK